MLVSFDPCLSESLTAKQMHSIASSLLDFGKLPTEWQDKLIADIDACGDWAVYEDE